MQASTKRYNQAVIATQRFTLGAKPNDLKAIGNNGQQWLLRQLNHSPSVMFDSRLPNSNQVLIAQAEYRQAKKAFKQQTKATNMLDNNMMSEAIDEPAMIAKAPKNTTGLIYKQLTLDALTQSINSDQSLNWRFLDFFSNHFSVSTQGALMRGLAPTLEREAIAPHLMGRFEDMLIAVSQHPAMLIYLNNENSIGPSTRFAKKNRGLNENLAREILELHTLGVNGGYQQQDVTELAKGITGWSVSRPGKDKQSGFIFRKNKHEPGTRMLLGQRYVEQGLGQGKAMLKTLARHPQTAQFVCTKIVRHFISDEPNENLVKHLTQAWHDSQGNLKKVLTALITHPAAWQAETQKFKTPREYVISTYRALSDNNLPVRQAHNALTQLGQTPFKAGSPAGYSDKQQDWDGASALMSKINWVSKLARSKNLRTVNINNAIDNLFANTLSTHTYQMVTRAESRQQALTLLLLSPEFLRR